MADTSRVDYSIYLFNAYSNLDSKKHFLSGSDRVGIKLIEQESSSTFVIAPRNFQKLLPEKVKFISSDDLKVNNLLFRYVFRTFKTFFILKSLLKSLNKKSKIINIISTSDFFPDVAPSFFFSSKLKWYSFTYHLYPLNFNLRNFLGRSVQVISFLMLKKSYRILTTSKESENFLKKNFHYTNVLNIPLGLDYGLYKGNKEKNNNDLVFLGRIKKSKGVFDLPEIIKSVVKSFPKIKLFVIGNGNKEDIDYLKTDIKKNNLEKNIFILNNLLDEEVKNYLSSSRILIQPSYEEGFGLSVLEALASNMEVVVYNLPVYKEHFSDFDLTYIEIGNKLQFSKKINEILNSNDKVNYQKAKFLRFSWSEIFVKIFTNR